MPYFENFVWDSDNTFKSGKDQNNEKDIYSALDVYLILEGLLITLTPSSWDDFMIINYMVNKIQNK